MANRFAYPPPPPPPPAVPSSYQQPQRGRGGFNSTFSRGGRGRAEYGGARGNRSSSHSGYSYQQRNGFSQQTNRNDQLQNISTNPIKAPGSHGGKRTHEQAFYKNAVPKVQAAPSVPSFGFNLPSLIPQQPTVPLKNVPIVAPKRNLLGLTPADDDEEATDEDEETKLAATICSAPGSAISFLYKGKLAVLKTAEDVAAWIAERRRNFPTAARREAMAKKRAEELAKAAELKELARKKAIEAKAERQAKSEDKRIRASHKQARQNDKQVKLGDKPDHAKEKVRKPQTAELPLTLSKEQLKIEKLRKTMEKNAKKLAKLEAATKSLPNIALETGPTTTLSKIESIETPLDDLAMSDSSTSSDEETSSSDSTISDESDISSGSDPDSDLDDSSDEFTDKETNGSDEQSQSDSGSDSDAPQELSSTRTAPIRVAPPPRGREDSRALCGDLGKYGKCRRRGCKFRHKPKDSERTSLKKREQKPGEKLSLYQRLLKQQMEEDERAKLESDESAAA